MSRGYRFLVTAACGLTLLAALGTGAFFGSLYTPNHKQYQAVAGDQSRHDDYAGPSQSLPDIAGLPGPVERVIANPQPTTGQDHEKRDLAAQEASALWAFWMVVISFFSVLTTAIGTIFLYKQIVLTREAVEDTGLATEAMREANAIAKDASSKEHVRHRASIVRERELDKERRAGERRQLRAYVDFNAVEWATTDRLANPGCRWEGVRVKLKNYGQTPADKLEIDTAFTIKKDGQSVAGIENKFRGIGGIMPTDKNSHSSFMEFGEAQFMEIYNRNATLNVSINVRYVDAFGDPHILCAVYVSDGITKRLGCIPGTRIAD